MWRVPILITIVLFVACNNKTTIPSNSDELQIRKVLNDQQLAWNNGNIDNFMKGYWKSDQLKFSGNNGITYGWSNTLENYKKSYPSNEKMGKLFFTIDALERIGKDGFYLIGRYELKRINDTPTGYFTLIWKQINGKWKIISDMTCG